VVSSRLVIAVTELEDELALELVLMNALKWEGREISLVVEPTAVDTEELEELALVGDR